MINRINLVRLVFVIAIICNVAFWFSVRPLKAEWGNVPPVPDKEFASSIGLGDASFAYRINGIMLQNLGDAGGRSTPLKDYDYDALTNWFFLQDTLDPHSSYIPYLVAYYFSATQTPEQFTPALRYLEQVGSRPEGENWRWLAQAVFLARFVVKDQDMAMKMAETLAKLPINNLPQWALQMPAFIMTDRGDKEAAYAFFLQILKSSADKLHPNEVNQIRHYVCSKVLDEQKAKENPLCENLK